VRLVLLPPRKANGNQIINIQLQPNCNQQPRARERRCCAPSSSQLTTEAGEVQTFSVKTRCAR
jgi:hypothetical protein